MSFNSLLVLIIILSGCATHSEKLTEKLRERFPAYPQHKLINVPFYNQEEYYCAPATLAMVSNYLEKRIVAEDIAKILYTPEMKGTFQNDVLAATRRLGFIAIPINNLEKLLISINENIPVLIFQNLGLSWIPSWHYSLVVGYDLEEKEMILHTGEYKNYRMKISTFERIWNRVQNWGLAIVNVGSIPPTASEDEMVKATAGLELANHFLLAQQSYNKILNKWSESLGALVGLGNIHYQFKNYKKSQKYFEKATSFHPQSFGAWYNYIVLLVETKQIKNAKIAIEKAVKNTDPKMKENYRLKLDALLQQENFI